MSTMEELNHGERYALEFGEPFAVGVARCVCDGVVFGKWQDADVLQRAYAAECAPEIVADGLIEWREENDEAMKELVAFEHLGELDERDLEELRELREALDVLQRANDLLNSARIMIRDEGGILVRPIVGRLVAHMSTEREGVTRWMELELYRTKDHRLLLREIGQTINVGERQLNTFTVYETEEAMLEDRGHDHYSLLLYDQAMIYTVAT